MKPFPSVTSKARRGSPKEKPPKPTAAERLITPTKRSWYKTALGWLLPVLGALVAIGYFGAMLVLGTNPPLVPTMGKSMQPLLHQGDLAVIRQVTPSEIEVGDVIAFRTTESVQTRFGVPSLVLHRVTDVNEGRQGLVFTTIGDNNSEEDPYQTAEANVVGEMVAFVPRAGIPLLMVMGPYGQFLLIGAGILLAVYIGLGWYEKAAARGRARDELMIELTKSLSRMQEQLDAKER